MSAPALDDPLRLPRWGLCALVVLLAHLAAVLVWIRAQPVAFVPPGPPSAIMVSLAPPGSGKSGLQPMPEVQPEPEPPPAPEPPKAPEPQPDTTPPPDAVPPPDSAPKTTPIPDPPTPVSESVAAAEQPMHHEPVPKSKPVPVPEPQPKPRHHQPARTPPDDKPQPQPPEPEAKPSAPAATAAAPATAPSASEQHAPATAPMDMMRAWQRALMRHLEHYKRYPRAAVIRRREGTVYLHFVMNRRGEVLSWHIRRSSGYAALDREAKAMIQRAAPLPPPPPEVTRARIVLDVPIQFVIR